jgi:hypothetical protein
MWWLRATWESNAQIKTNSSKKNLGIATHLINIKTEFSSAFFFFFVSTGNFFFFLFEIFSLFLIEKRLFPRETSILELEKNKWFIFEIIFRFNQRVRLLARELSHVLIWLGWWDRGLFGRILDRLYYQKWL